MKVRCYYQCDLMENYEYWKPYVQLTVDVLADAIVCLITGEPSKYLQEENSTQQ